MLRRNCALLPLLIAYAAVAAPAPKGGWDKPIDPDRDCKFTFKDGTITIELPGGDHDLDPKRKRFNAPHMLREVEGDFVMQVRVSALFRPSAKSSVDGKDPRVAAGLVLIPADKNYIRIEYGAYRRKGMQENTPTSRMQGDQLGMNGYTDWIPENCHPDPRAAEERIYLRLERQGKRIRESASPDGKTWAATITVEDTIIPNKLKVGLAAYSTSTEPFKVRFDQFKFVRGQKKSK